MARYASFRLYRSMFENEGTLLVSVTLDTSRIHAGRQSRLFEFETAMGIMAIAALHYSFEHLVMERQIELVFYFRVTTQAKLRLAHFQQLDHREARLLSVRLGDEDIRTGYVFPGLGRMYRMTIRATDVVAPVFATTEVVVFFLARVTGKTGLGSCLG
jgi:hypothetical protein